MWWKKKEKHYLYLTREELRVVMTSLVTMPWEEALPGYQDFPLETSASHS